MDTEWRTCNQLSIITIPTVLGYYQYFPDEENEKRVCLSFKIGLYLYEKFLQ